VGADTELADQSSSPAPPSARRLHPFALRPQSAEAAASRGAQQQTDRIEVPAREAVKLAAASPKWPSVRSRRRAAWDSVSDAALVDVDADPVPTGIVPSARLLTPVPTGPARLVRPGTAGAAISGGVVRSRRRRTSSTSPSSHRPVQAAAADEAAAAEDGDADAVAADPAATEPDARRQSLSTSSTSVSRMTPAQARRSTEDRSAQLAGAYFARQAAAAQIKLERLKQMRGNAKESQ